MSGRNYYLALDDQGFPKLIDGSDLLALARTYTPPPSVSGPKQVVSGTRSGNPWHDPRSGKFAHSPPGVAVRGGGSLLKTLLNSSKRHISARVAATNANAISAEPAKDGNVKITLFIGSHPVAVFLVPGQQTSPRQARIEDKDTGTNEPIDHVPSSVPAGVDPEEWQRRMDAVRDAAREFDFLAHGDVQEFLQGRTKRPLTDDEIDTFVNDVRMQRLNDIADWLDQSLRRADMLRRRSRRHVRINIPRGWAQRTLNGLDNEELQGLVPRLEGRGIDRERIIKRIVGAFSGKRQDELRGLFSVTEKPEE